jgi:hypothetical protein
VPARRTHRFTLCEALDNTIEAELGEPVGVLLADDRYDSLRGRLCTALAKSGYPQAAGSIAAVLEKPGDETKLCALEALGILKATDYAREVRKFSNYHSSDKEWTRAIKKAAAQALKRMKQE